MKIWQEKSCIEIECIKPTLVGSVKKCGGFLHLHKQPLEVVSVATQSHHHREKNRRIFFSVLGPEENSALGGGRG
jgi:hypothetical protein